LKSTGVTRKIDELGRVVIPKEIRRNLGIRDGENLEIFTDEESIILKKHSLISRYEDLAIQLTELIHSIYKLDILITDREKVISSSIPEKVLNKKIEERLVSLIDNRESYVSKEKASLKFEDFELNGYITIMPIIAASDSLGLVILSSNELKNQENLAKFVAKILADKINIF